VISKKSLDKFIEIYKKECGTELTKKNAEEKATKLVRLYKAFLGDPLIDLIQNNKNNDKQ